MNGCGASHEGVYVAQDQVSSNPGTIKIKIDAVGLLKEGMISDAEGTIKIFLNDQLALKDDIFNDIYETAFNVSPGGYVVKVKIHYGGTWFFVGRVPRWATKESNRFYVKSGDIKQVVFEFRRSSLDNM